MQSPHAPDLFLSVADMIEICRLLRLKHSVDAFRRNDDLPLVVEDKGRVLTVIDDDIYLLAEHSLAIHNVRLVRLVTRRCTGSGFLDKSAA